jgi:hypothetical protein
MPSMNPEKLILFDYSGTLSLEAPRFGRPENLFRALEGSGLAALGITSPELFWDGIVTSTWIEGSTTGSGYKRVMARRIAALKLSPDAPETEIGAAAGRFIDAYLAHSRINPRWRPILTRLSISPAVCTMIATDHYAEATEAIAGFLEAWSIPAKRASDGSASTDSASACEKEPGVAPADEDRKRFRKRPSHKPGLPFFVANSADLGVWKADRRFWEILQARLPLKAVRRILLIDDFGLNEQAGDDYGGQAKASAREEKTRGILQTVFQTSVEVIPFYLEGKQRDREKECSRLIAETGARIDRFLGGDDG